MRRIFFARHLRNVHEIPAHEASELALFSMMEIDKQHTINFYYKNISSEEELFENVLCNQKEFDECIDQFIVNKCDAEVSSNMLVCNEAIHRFQ
jgi:hypothetical protein